ncbi:hypothetical protein AOLI_G00127790 [Acnodon oligacanthus]
MNLCPLSSSPPCGCWGSCLPKIPFFCSETQILSRHREMEHLVQLQRESRETQRELEKMKREMMRLNRKLEERRRQQEVETQKEERKRAQRKKWMERVRVCQEERRELEALEELDKHLQLSELRALERERESRRSERERHRLARMMDALRQPWTGPRQKYLPTFYSDTEMQENLQKKAMDHRIEDIQLIMRSGDVQKDRKITSLEETVRRNAAMILQLKAEEEELEKELEELKQKMASSREQKCLPELGVQRGMAIKMTKRQRWMEKASINRKEMEQEHEKQKEDDLFQEPVKQKDDDLFQEPVKQKEEDLLKEPLKLKYEEVLQEPVKQSMEDLLQEHVKQKEVLKRQRQMEKASIKRKEMEQEEQELQKQREKRQKEMERELEERKKELERELEKRKEQMERELEERKNEMEREREVIEKNMTEKDEHLRDVERRLEKRTRESTIRGKLEAVMRKIKTARKKEAKKEKHSHMEMVSEVEKEREMAEEGEMKRQRWIGGKERQETEEEKPSEAMDQEPVKQKEDDLFQEPVKQKEEDLLKEPLKLKHDVLQEPMKQSMEDLLQEPVKQKEKDLLKELVQQRQENLLQELVQQKEVDLLQETVKESNKDLLQEYVQQREEDLHQEPLTMKFGEVLQEPVNQNKEDLLQEPVKQSEKDLLQEPVQQRQENLLQEPVQQRKENQKDARERELEMQKARQEYMDREQRRKRERLRRMSAPGQNWFISENATQRRGLGNRTMRNKIPSKEKKEENTDLENKQDNLQRLSWPVSPNGEGLLISVKPLYPCAEPEEEPRDLTLSTAESTKDPTPENLEKQEINAAPEEPSLQPQAFSEIQKDTQTFTDDSKLPSEEDKEEEKTSSQADDLKESVLRTFPKGTMVQCCIQRDRMDVNGPTYRLFQELEEGKKELLLVARRMNNKPYEITVGESDEAEKAVWRLRSHRLDTVYTLCNGDIKKESSTQMLLAVSYVAKLGFLKTQKMTAIVPSPDRNSQRVGLFEGSTLKEIKKNNQAANLIELETKKPEWDKEKKAYVLDFNGRVKQSSVKNCQLACTANPDQMVLQFGRVDEDCFVLDFSFPLCALQAFAISLTCFDD